MDSYNGLKGVLFWAFLTSLIFDINYVQLNMLVGENNECGIIGNPWFWFI